MSENGAPHTDGGDYKTFAGAGFGTLMIQYSGGRRETPEVASSRGMLRSGLPSIYREEDFGMRFVGALEELLDPIVAILDGLSAHFDPDLAPRDVLDLVAVWLGVDLDESQSIAARRDKVRHAAELGRRRGTVAGLQLALKLSFPNLPLRVEDGGGVSWSTDPSPKAEPGVTQFIVYCDRPIPAEQQAAVARCIEQVKPIHTSYRLRVKAPKKQQPAPESS
jgi:phage tail-like protein